MKIWISNFFLSTHTGPVPNGSDPILERTISVHTVPFRLSTSVHTGSVCYGSVLNRSKKSSCFYQLSMRRIHVVAFKMAPKYQKEPVQVFTRWRIRQKEPVQVFTRWRIRLGPKRFQKLDLLFWRSSFRTWSGTDWRLAGPVWTKGLSVTIFRSEPFRTGPVWT